MQLIPFAKGQPAEHLVQVSNAVGPYLTEVEELAHICLQFYDQLQRHPTFAHPDFDDLRVDVELIKLLTKATLDPRPSPGGVE